MVGRVLPFGNIDRACADRAFRRAFVAYLGRCRHARRRLSYPFGGRYFGDCARFEILRIRLRGVRAPFRADDLGVRLRYAYRFQTAFKMSALRKAELV